jgi:hypothetical protein
MICSRHFGGINYPVGGVGAIAENMVKGEQRASFLSDVADRSLSVS